MAKALRTCGFGLPNITKISTWIGWTPKKSLDEILIETITYYKQTIPSHTA
jgi:nucleoside-diphosphate-sugar epimerase